MMFYNSSSSNNNNNTPHCNAHNTHSVGNVSFKLDCSCNTISNCSCRRTAATTLTSSKQRSSSGCKKYRRAKLLDDAISCCNDNSSNIGKPYLPAFTPTTATATVEETTKAFSESASSATHNGSTQRRRRSTAYCNLVAASSPAHLSTVLATVFGICRALSLPLCLLLLLRLTPAVRCLAVGVETANANITDLGSPGE
ncbi:uncharacterized protein LOC105664832 [Ceratitis capitata]|uniref:uncharacterized protein LOC105664832 n=1 Tax=Ceratitis capitata TaxID=7213 RepID=UPI0006187E6D|nr:uncharacterized protein LOC105664832 [Ceratitis capitata]